MIFHADFHIHTQYSPDSLASPKTILKTVKKRGLQIIAITDHNTITGGIQTKRLAPDSIEVIVGSEIKVDCGEIIGLFLQEEILPGPATEVIDSIRDQGGISIFAHPFRKKNADITIPYQRCDVIEGWNGRTNWEINQLAQEEAKKFGKYTVCGSDAHFPFEIGAIRNQVCLDDPSDIQEQLRKKILNGGIQPVLSSRYPWVGIAGYYLSGGLKRVTKKNQIRITF